MDHMRPLLAKQENLLCSPTYIPDDLRIILSLSLSLSHCVCVCLFFFLSLSLFHIMNFFSSAHEAGGVYLIRSVWRQPVDGSDGEDVDPEVLSVFVKPNGTPSYL